MNRSVIGLFVFLCAITTFAKDAQTVSSAPDRFLIARHTFIDVGPPNDFYEIISVRGTSTNSTTVERITLTPAGDACINSPTVEMAASDIPDPVSVVLEGRNPCAIPDKALQKELKRRKQGLVFSGAEISMHVQCGGKERIIRADVLDRDMFDPKAATPDNTSWTMRVLTRLDKVFPGGVWDRPMFDGSTEPTRAAAPKADARALASGEYDHLFAGAPDRPSDLYRASQTPPPSPDIRLRSSEPFQPEKVVLPGYPPLARLARIEGTVVVTFQVDANGGVTDAQFDSGHPMLRPTVANALSGWKFPKEAADHRVKATIDFKTNCPSKTQ